MSDKAFRMLVTGSRAWTNDKAVEVLILQTWQAHNEPSEVILVSGACPTGADAMAEAVATGWGWTVERHPADWVRYGKRAGFIRNQEMVDLGADVCLAFILNKSKGASMTRKIAEKAGIPTNVLEMNDEAD